MWTENVFVTRPGHSVSPFWNFFQGLRGLPCLQLPQACQNQHYRTKPSWDFLADSDATFDIGGNWNVDWKWSSWVGQAMQFPRFEGFFLKLPEVFLVHNSHKPAKTSIIVPKPYNFWVDSDATFDIGGNWNVDWKWCSWVGQAKVPEVFHVHNFHKPAETSIIVPKPSSFLADSDATFDIGGSWNVSFPVSKVFFQGARGLPCPQLPQACQNQPYRTKTLYSFVKTQLLTLVGVEMWTENGLRESARPCSFPVLRFFQRSLTKYTHWPTHPLSQNIETQAEFQPGRLL